jgi:hypothetical protein
MSRPSSTRTAGDSVISVDTKTKELVGPFSNPGVEWRPKGAPEQVSTHDFPDRQLGKAVPYGIYDVAANTGWVNVGIDHDIAAFAVESMRRWWNGAGRAAYPRARRLLVTADAGGSNGYRPGGLEGPAGRARRGDRPGDHRVPYAAGHLQIATTTRTGLSVHAELDSGRYPIGIQINDQEMATFPITRHDFHGDWNSTLLPQRRSAAGVDVQDLSVGTVDSVAVANRATAYHPALTGMSHQTLAGLTTELTDAWIDQREARRHHRRGGQPRYAAGGGGVPKLDLAGRLVAALLDLRFHAPSLLIGQLLGVSGSRPPGRSGRYCLC